MQWNTIILNLEEEKRREEAGQVFSENSIYYSSFLTSLGDKLVSHVLHLALISCFTALQNTKIRQDM